MNLRLKNMITIDDDIVVMKRKLYEDIFVYKSIMQEKYYVVLGRNVLCSFESELAIDFKFTNE